jgi:hypothetical protein
MKRFFTLFTFLSLAAARLEASAHHTYDANAVALATALLHCGAEMEELRAKTDKVVSAELSAPRPADPNIGKTHYTVTVGKSGDPQGLWTQLVARLHVLQVTVFRPTPARVSYSCEIEWL